MIINTPNNDRVYFVERGLMDLYDRLIPPDDPNYLMKAVNIRKTVDNVRLHRKMHERLRLISGIVMEKYYSGNKYVDEYVDMMEKYFPINALGEEYIPEYC